MRDLASTLSKPATELGRDAAAARDGDVSEGPNRDAAAARAGDDGSRRRYAPSASAAPDPAADGWRQVSSEQAVARAAADAKKAKKDAKREKKESKKDSKKKKSKKESRKRPRDDDAAAAAAGDDDAPLLGYVREALPAPETLPLMPAGKQGEVVAPSWRGAREPGAVSSWSSRRPEKDVGYGGGSAAERRSLPRGVAATPWPRDLDIPRRGSSEDGSRRLCPLVRGR